LSNQGQWSLGLGYDELRHNIVDTYQTPLQGSVGGNNFTLPANFGTINAQSNPSARVLTSTQQAAFHTEKIGTTRKNTSVSLGYALNSEMNLEFNFNRLDQSGAKLMAVAAGGYPAASGTWRAEALSIVPNPTSYKTDTFNLALNWAGEKGHLSGGYFGSIFTDNFNSLSVQNPFLSNSSTSPAGIYQTNVMSTAPDNSLHQLNLSGGYVFSPTTKLVGGVSYGRNAQDSSYLTGGPEVYGALPATSLNGLVVNTHADLKLTHQVVKELTLTAALKYNERDNRTQSSKYYFYAINNVNGVDTNQPEGAANAPYSNRRTQLELAADYRLGIGNNLRFSYERDDISRWCGNYSLAANCLINPSNQENKFGLNFRQNSIDGISFNAGYVLSNRSAQFEGNGITPLAGLDRAGGSDVNAQNFAGYVAYPYSARKQQLIKAGVSLQATDRLEIGLNGRFVDDKYDAALGVQDGRTVGVNLDATYAYAENSTVSAYASRQNSDRNLNAAWSATTADFTQPSYNLLVTPTKIWTNQLTELSNSVGLNTKHSGLLGGKLEVLGDVSYSLDNSKYSTQVPYTSGATLCSLSTVLTCGDTPDIQTKVLTIKLVTSYQVVKSGKITLGLVHQEMTSSDYFYNGEQYGYTPNRVMPTNLQAPNYVINVGSVSYSYLF
jgi:MtrB/PioB family decaheme-associated outer membrane protein